MTPERAIAVLRCLVHYSDEQQAVDTLEECVEALKELSNWADNFHARVVGECGSAWMEGDHNAEKFVIAMERARAALQPVP